MKYTITYLLVLELDKRRCVEVPPRRAGCPVASEGGAVYVVEQVVHAYIHRQRPEPHFQQGVGGVDTPCLEAVGIVVVHVVAGGLIAAVHSQAQAVVSPCVLPGGVERGVVAGGGVDVEVLHVVVALVGGILRFRVGIAVSAAQHDVFRRAVVEGEIHAVDAGFR